MNLKHIKRSDHCFNCNEPLNIEKDNFCSHCGQVNNTKKETAFGLVRELVEEFLHLDSKVSNSLIPLLTKPGKLTVDYNTGKRARYFHPVRLFLTVTVIMFLLNGIFGKEKKVINGKKDSDTIFTADSVSLDGDSVKFGSTDSTTFVYNDSVGKVNWNFGGSTVNKDSVLTMANAGYSREQIMDSLKIEHTFINKLVIGQVIKSRSTTFKEIKEYYRHRLPWIIFSLMPVFAFVVWLMYLRKKIYFVDHLIFAFHLHTAVFVLYSIMILLEGITGWTIFEWLELLIPVYYYLAIKNVYKQSWGKTILKGTLIGVMYFFLGLSTFVTIASAMFLAY